MKTFIIKIVVFSSLTLSAIFLMLFQADGYTDPFYIRFTTPQQHSLILGSSRAAQGLQPQVINKICNTTIYNYAFTIDHSPYGETYLNSIKKKLKKDSQNGVFIITVDPWSISSKSETPNDSNNFRELDLCLGITDKVDVNPNFNYIFNNLKGEYYKTLRRYYALPRKDKFMFLHENGWLELGVNMDSAFLKSKIERNVKDYKEYNLPFYKYSSYRLDYLKTIIKFLNTRGKVYLVRLPIHEKMMAFENELMPDFNTKIETLIPLTEGYLDLTPFNTKYNYIDANHMHSTSGKIASKQIA